MSPDRRPGEGGRPRLTYGDGRVCSVDGCGTMLSRYNAAPECFRHRNGYLTAGGNWRQTIDGPGATRR